MTDNPRARSDPPHGLVITLREVWEQGQETRETLTVLAKDVGELVAVNKRLDAHSKTLVEHDGRLDKLEIAQAIVTAQTKPKAPWYAVTGAIVGIVAGVVSIITLLSLLGQISQALTP